MSGQEVGVLMVTIMRATGIGGEQSRSLASHLLASDWLRDHDRALRESITADIEAERIFCPVHQVPDCSPMLNGCSLVIHVTTWRDNLARKVARGEQP